MREDRSEGVRQWEEQVSDYITSNVTREAGDLGIIVVHMNKVV